MKLRSEDERRRFVSERMVEGFGLIATMFINELGFSFEDAIASMLKTLSTARVTDRGFLEWDVYFPLKDDERGASGMKKKLDV